MPCQSLDQVLSFGDNHVTTEDALDVTGGVTTAVLGKYLAAVLAKDHAQALKMVEDLLAAGKDAGRLIEDLIGICVIYWSINKHLRY